MTENFDEADRFLIDKWTQARELEERLNAIRNSFAVLLQQSLPARIDMAERPWWNANSFNTLLSAARGKVAFGRKAWSQSSEFTGLWIEGLDLDSLLRHCRTPTASVWIANPRTGGRDIVAIRTKFCAVASEELKILPPPVERRQAGYIFSYDLGERPQRIVASIFENGGKDFIEVIISEADRLARLIPAIDLALA